MGGDEPTIRSIGSALTLVITRAALIVDILCVSFVCSSLENFGLQWAVSEVFFPLVSFLPKGASILFFIEVSVSHH